MIVNCDRIIDLLASQYHLPAHTEDTGGGCQTIMVGPSSADPFNDPPFLALCGPGWREGPRATSAVVAETDDLSVGPDEYAPGDLCVRFGPADTETTIATAIAWYVLATAPLPHGPERAGMLRCGGAFVTAEDVRRVTASRRLDTVADVRALMADCVDVFGLAFHADTPGADYIGPGHAPTFTAAQAGAYDELITRAFRACDAAGVDLYALTSELPEWRARAMDGADWYPPL